MNLFKQPRTAANPDHIQRLKGWAYEVLKLETAVPISISQLQCHEPGCPPVETVIAVMTQPVQTFKIHAPVGEISRDQVIQAMAPPSP
ncbi:hypothetical protein C7271_23360 [filamentous cyanobacterium CCP5]|nr:hypothetical protein C7271_23360 [filamentous cyanobacterium CCP5]